MEDQTNFTDGTYERQVKHNLRQQALSTAEIIQPSQNLSNFGQPQQAEKSVTKLLSDAETIYNWLIKDL